MAVTATQYIVWNNRESKVVAGPFATSGEADTARRRASVKSEGLNKETQVFTTEAITTVKQK